MNLHPVICTGTVSLSTYSIDCIISSDLLPLLFIISRESRTWILNVLYQGLKTKEDWKIAQKLPTIKFLCSSFIFEKVKTQKSIVGILIHGARIAEIAEEMTDKYSIPLWLSNLSTTSKSLKIDLEFFFQTLVSNCPETEMRRKIFEFVGKKQKWSLTSSTDWPSKNEDEEAEASSQSEPGTEMDVDVDPNPN